MENIDINHVYNILAGDGHFEKTNGQMLNVIQMIAESFHEALAVRTLVHERFNRIESAMNSMGDISNKRFSNIEERVDSLKLLKGNSSQGLEILQKQLTKLQTDHGM